MIAEKAETGSLHDIQTVRQALLQQIASDSLDLPPLPQIANQVLTITGDPNADAAKLASLIHQDQALAGQVLRIANSPAYMPRSPIVSLQQAVSWLGMKMLGDMAVMICLQNGVFKLAEYEREVNLLWRQALATGLYAKEIARMRRWNVENAFLCGLLHSIGKPVILKGIVEIQRQQGVSLPWEAIQLLMDECHVQVGTQMATTWQLPATVIESMMYYANYAEVPSTSKTPMIICLADHLASHLLSCTQMTEEALRGLPVVHDLNFYPEDVTTLLEHGTVIQDHLSAMIL